MSERPERPAHDDTALAAAAAMATALVIPVVVAVGHLHLWMVVVVAFSAVLSYARADSANGLVALSGVALVWLAAAPERLSAWTLVVTLLMFTCHVCLSLRTTAPPETALGRTIRLRWLGRSAAVAGLTVAVYLAGLVLESVNACPTAEVVLVAALALVAGLVLGLRQETLHGR